MKQNHLIKHLHFLILIASNFCYAQSIQNTYMLPRISEDITIDGKVDEEVWSKIDPLPLTMHWPNYKSEITEETEIKVAYDDQYVYVGAICYDSDPSGIQGPTFQRDGISQQMDQITILFDTYNDNENTLAYIVTPTSSRADIAFKNDAQGDDAANFSWNSYWIASSTINDKGWQTEMRIPFGSLRFQVVNNKVEMGMIAYRFVARKRELNIYPSIPPDWGFLSFAKASQAQTVSFEGIQNKQPWYTSPYVLLSAGHHYEDNEQNEYTRYDYQDFQIGLDIQHAFNDNLNADFTINTDFAQVEADNQAVNLTRFSLFFPEKRRFFLERASTFDFKFDLNNNMFYSRRIGINDGELIPLYGGARLVGRMDKWDIGLLDMQSQPKGEFNSENFGIIRVRRNVFNPRSYVGGMFTSRLDTKGYSNLAYGLDGIINIFKQDYLQFNFAQTQDSEDTTGIAGIDKARIYLMWENRIVNGFGYRFSYSNVGANYNPGVGFERRFDYTRIGDQIFYSWFAPEESSLRQTTITLNGGLSLGNTSGELETYSMGLQADLIWDRDSRLSIGTDNFHDNVPEPFELSDDITIDAGSYSNTTGNVSYSTPAVSFFILGINGRVGSFYDGDLMSFGISPEVVFSKYFQLSASYQYTNINFKEMAETFVSHLGSLNMTGSVNVKLSASAFVQMNSLEEIGSINFRLRYNPVDGNDLYIVYNETLNSDPTSVVPNLPISDNRAIMIKYIHTFQL
jgi:hypothetical protein